MNNEISNKIVKLTEGIEFDLFNNSSDEYIVTNKDLGIRTVVNQYTYDLLKFADGLKNIETIVKEYNKIHPLNSIDVETAHFLFYDKLANQGIVQNDDLQLEKRATASHLSFSFTVLKKQRFQKFITFLSPVFVLKHYYKILLVGFLFVASIIYWKFDLISTTLKESSISLMILYLIISLIVVFMHEFGHATACKKLGAEPGDIGFGFYLLHPVMFADVSDIWKLKPKDRVIVNFAGMYVEVLIASFLIIIYFLTHQVFLLVSASFILLSFVVNLNPFFKYDGYWILSDLSHTPNLRAVSLNKVTEFFQQFFSGSKFNYTKKNIFLFAYGLISSLLIIGFIAYTLIKDPVGIISFPLDVFNYIKSLIKGTLTFDFSQLSRFFVPIIFYYIFFKVIVPKVSKYIKK